MKIIWFFVCIKAVLCLYAERSLTLKRFHVPFIFRYYKPKSVVFLTRSNRDEKKVAAEENSAF